MNNFNIIQKFKERCSHIDRVYWIIFGLLILIALVALHSASSTLTNNGSHLAPVLHQAGYILAGIVCAFGIQFIPTKVVRVLSYAALLVAIVLVALTFTETYGKEINGARRWVVIFGQQFQPSELAKISLLIVVADLLSKIKNKEDEKKYFFITLGITGLVCGMIMVSNLSTAILLGGIVFVLYFLTRVHIKYWGTTLLITIILLFCGYWYVEKQYVIPDKKVEGVMKRATVWAKRVDSMVAEWKAPTEENYSMEGNNYQRTIAVIAVAHGGASPLGVGPGNSTERKFLPQAFADYIFAIFAEEWGIIGSIILILLYLAILFRSVVISRKYADFAAMLMVMGLALMLTCQALISMMVSVGLGPVTGQPLPLISRGGTSAVITCIYFGIIMCVAREQNQLRSREEESIRDSLNNAPIIDIKE